MHWPIDEERCERCLGVDSAGPSSAERAALVADPRLPDVQPHPHLDPDALRPGVRRQVTLPIDRRRDRILRRLKRNEERVTLRVDLVAAVRREGGPQDPLLLGQNLRVLAARRWSSRVEPSMSVNRKVTVPR